jgi:hypothetical protein
LVLVNFPQFQRVRGILWGQTKEAVVPVVTEEKRFAEEKTKAERARGGVVRID